jgi:hypothetical protein
MMVGSWNITAGEADEGPMRGRFRPPPEVDFHGSRITSNAGILVRRALEDAHGDQLFVGPTRDKGANYSPR